MAGVGGRVASEGVLWAFQCRPGPVVQVAMTSSLSWWVAVGGVIGLLAVAPVRAAAPYRAPDMDKELFDAGKVELDKFDRAGVVGALLSVARDFDDKDKVDYELRAYALAIAGRLDQDNERVKTCLKQLKDKGETVGESADRPRVVRRLSTGVRALLRKKDNAANQACAAYVVDIALRFDPEGEGADKFGEQRDALAAADHKADWEGVLGRAVRHARTPWDEDEPEFVKKEVSMPGGKGKEFERPQSRINGLVVIQLPNGAEAGAASAVNATALAEEGVKGLLITFNQDVGPMMGGCLEEVVKFLRVRYAKQQDKVPTGHKIELGFQDKYQMKDGPSAATVFALVLDSLFSGEEIDDGFAATGDITADGMVQRIGGVAAKIRGATKRGCRIVGIPADNAKGVADVLVMDGPGQLVDIQIFTLKDFEEARAVSRKDKGSEVQATLDAFAKVAALVKEKGFDLLKDAAVQKQLEAVVARMPNHLSAKLLLDYGRGQAPERLSVGGTFQEIDILSSGVIRQVMRTLMQGEVKLNSELQKDAKEAAGGLEKIAAQIDPRLKDYHQSMLAVARIFADGRKESESDKEFIERINKAMEKLSAVRTKAQEDPEIMEEILG